MLPTSNHQHACPKWKRAIGETTGEGTARSNKELLLSG